VIYLDSSALVKLALSEPESAALTSYLAARPGQDLVSSTLHRAEVLRAIWRSEPGALPRAQRIIRRVSVVSLTHDLLDNAATQAPASLGTTAAIHLVSALTIKRGEVFTPEWGPRPWGWEPDPGPSGAVGYKSCC